MKRISGIIVVLIVLSFAVMAFAQRGGGYGQRGYRENS